MDKYIFNVQMDRALDKVCDLNFDKIKKHKSISLNDLDDDDQNILLNEILNQRGMDSVMDEANYCSIQASLQLYLDGKEGAAESLAQVFRKAVKDCYYDYLNEALEDHSARYLHEYNHSGNDADYWYELDKNSSYIFGVSA